MKGVEKKPARTTMPVALLIESRECMVVGGGKVAARKTQGLLDAGAQVVVVSPNLGEKIQRLVDAKCVTYLAKAFEPSDLDERFLVFAATDNKMVNKSVLEAAKARHIFACAVDNSWVDGDFVSAAVVRQHGLTLSVSSNGRSCRKSKLVKESLTRHLEMIETADLMVLGTSHAHLSVEEREPFHLIGERIESVGAMLMQVWGVHEFMLLNTCNRVELIAVVAKEVDANGLLERIMGFDQLENGHYYNRRGFEAFKHVAKMTAGLYSQIPGENHIANQVKVALNLADEKGWAAGMIHQWMSSALHISKDIRQMASPILKDFEIEDLAMEYLKQEAPKPQVAMVIGSGVVGKDLVKRFLKKSVKCVWAFHRNRPELPESWQGQVEVCNFDKLPIFLPKVDTVVCATSSPEPVLDASHSSFLTPNNHVVIMDLAMPRNVAPAIAEDNNSVSIVDLDNLKHWYRRNLADLPEILKRGKEIAYEHNELYEKLIRSFQGGHEAK